MCFLCTQCTDNAIGNIQFGSHEAELLNVKEIIEKHFWLRVAIAKKSNLYILYAQISFVD